MIKKSYLPVICKQEKKKHLERQRTVKGKAFYHQVTQGVGIRHVIHYITFTQIINRHRQQENQKPRKQQLLCPAIQNLNLSKW
jgi:hypothetical protein